MLHPILRSNHMDVSRMMLLDYPAVTPLRLHPNFSNPMGGLNRIPSHILYTFLTKMSHVLPN